MLGFTESVFADDLNCWCGFSTNNTNTKKAMSTTEHQAHALSRLQDVQKNIHDWGEANRVLFGSSKESVHLMHRCFGQGDNSKLLGMIFDSGLLMHDAARTVASEAGWRLQTLLKVRRLFTTPDIFRMYKLHILSYVESEMPAFYTQRHLC